MARTDLAVRCRRAELMDDPGIDRVRHLHALRALARVNRISFSAARVWREVMGLAAARSGPVRVLDIACGGGDMLVTVARWARRRGVPIELHGCDVSPVALDAARASAPDATALRFFELDVLGEELPEGYDLICSSLFLHHLSEDFAVRLLRAMAAATAASLLVQDLQRTRLGYLFAYAGLLLLTRSDVARSDGLTSVQSAFTLAEAAKLCAEAGLEGADIRPCWPQRYAIRWSRS